MSDATRVWYFGYGSNMQKATFIGRRGMRPDKSAVGRLDGYRLTFDLPMGDGERGCANIAADPLAHVYGVLHRITEEEFEKLDKTEGVHRGVYDRLAIDVEAGGDRIEAVTYISRHRNPGRKPSPRYIGLLLDGAREYGLPAVYVAYLESLDLAFDEREDAS